MRRRLARFQLAVSRYLDRQVTYSSVLRRADRLA